MTETISTPGITYLRGPSGAALLIDARTPGGAAALRAWRRGLAIDRRARAQSPAGGGLSASLTHLERRLERQAANDILTASVAAVLGDRPQAEAPQ